MEGFIKDIGKTTCNMEMVNIQTLLESWEKENGRQEDQFYGKKDFKDQ